MEMKPGASPHCGMKAVFAVGRDFLDAAGRSNVFGEIQIVRPGPGGSFRQLDGQVVGQGAHHRELAGEQGNQCVGIVDVNALCGDRIVLFQRVERRLVAVDHGDLIVAGMRQHAGNGRADLACASHHNLFHRYAPSCKFLCAFPRSLHDDVKSAFGTIDVSVFDEMTMEFAK